MMENLVIDRKAGLYRFDARGKPHAFPSVTHVIDEVLYKHRWANEDALLRGQLVHRASAILDGWGGGGGLNWQTVHPALMGYVIGYVKFKEETGFIPTVVEESVYSLRYHYAGTPDKMGYFLARKLRGPRAIVDLKTGKIDPCTGVQLAAYRRAYKEMHRMREDHIKRYGLELRENGDYRLRLIDDPADFYTWLNALGVYKFWMEEYGGNPNDYTRAA